MARLLEDLVRRHGAGTAVADPRITRTWPELDARVDRWVHLLRDEGLAPGDAVAVVAGNRVEVLELLLAVLSCGLRVVPVNWHLTAAEIGHLVGDSAPAAVVVDDARAPAVAQALRACGSPARRLVLGAAAQHGFRPVEPLLDRMPAGDPDDQVTGGVAFYTSGTTGRPRAVQNGSFPVDRPPAVLSRVMANAGVVLGCPRTGRVLMTGPWYHAAQLWFALMPLLRGCTLLIEDRFDPERFLRLVDEQSVSLCHLVPTQLVRLLRLPEAVRAGFDGSSLRRVWHGGGPCPVEVKHALIRWLGPVLVEYYAATEGGFATLIDSAEWLERPGSVGRAIAPTKLLVADADGRPLPPGQVGRVFLCRSPEADFRYRGDPAATAAAHLAPGVFTFGELGRLDDEGYLYLAGRVGGRIVTGGVNVDPAEVEAALLAHPAVADAAVVGVPDEEFGERVAALVQLGAPASAQALDRHCRERLAGFKVPREWRFVDALPRDESGKLRRGPISALLADA